MRVPKRVAVIGAGIGGLTAAMQLAHHGCEVTVFEKQSAPGGRCGRVTLSLLGQPFHFDLGPTILLMPHVLRNTFASVGESLEQHLKLTRCDPHYRIHFRDESHVTLWTNPEKMKAELERLEPHSYARYLDFLQRAQAKHDVAMPHFVSQHFDSLAQFLAPKNLGPLFKTQVHKTLAGEIQTAFKDPRLQQAFSFQTMYLGLSPHEAPSVFSLLPFTEANEGLWHCEGGLSSVSRALHQVGLSKGVRFRLSTSVSQITVSQGKANGVLLSTGHREEFDAVLCNADYAWTTKNLLPKNLSLSRTPALERKRFTSSGVMFYWALGHRPEALLHHNVFFGNNYDASFADIFEHQRVPADVSFYVAAPSRTDHTMAPAGHDALYVLVPVPHQAPHLDWKKESDSIRKQVVARLASRGIHVDGHLLAERCITPDDWANNLNLERGSNFGLAQNLWQIGPMRPKVTDPDIENLFFCGASIQPGTGVPTVMLSARFAVEAMLQKRVAEVPRYPLAEAV